MKRFLPLFLIFALASAALAQDISNPQTDASKLTTGTLPAGRMPALTGDTTSSAGTVATTTTSINGVNQTTSWTVATPSITCGVGSVTAATVAVRSKVLGKTVFIEGNVTITTLNTCAGTTITVPITGTAASGTPLIGYNGTLGTSFPAQINSGATSATLIFTPAAQNYFFAGVYEQQ